MIARMLLNVTMKVFGRDGSAVKRPSSSGTFSLREKGS